MKNYIKNRNFYTVIFLLTILLSSLELKAQVTIGSDEAPAGGALLDLNTTTLKKGLLFPRVALESKTYLHPMLPAGYASTENSKHTGLIVYNTATTATDFVPGLYMWNGTEWRSLSDIPAVQPEITGLLNTSYSIIPNTYTASIPYSGVLKIAYTGGNGGTYPGTGQVPIGHNLYISRIAGTLSVGGGEVMYYITGSPDQSSIAGSIDFNVTFLGYTCRITMGGSVPRSAYVKSLVDDVRVDSRYIVNNTAGSASIATVLPFERIDIAEPGTYVFSLRLYGHITNDVNARLPFYIYLQRGNRDDVLDAAEIDLVTAPNQGQYSDYSYSISMGGTFAAGDQVIISMNSPSGGTSPYWELKKGDNALSPIRTSLVYWRVN